MPGIGRSGRRTDRCARVVAVLLTGGTALLAHLAAWLLTPQAERTSSAPPAAAPAAVPPVRDAWRAVGTDLRTRARRAAAGLGTAIDATLDDAGKRVRRHRAVDTDTDTDTERR